MKTRGDFSVYEEAMQFVKGRVLDVGCGEGRHSLYLQEKWFDVLGIDISPLAIKVCAGALEQGFEFQHGT
jgi:2-polyprenyl-3-methyl-5-hydroxy-6-metoxy-1,4-benzoquinol methylase